MTRPDYAQVEMTRPDWVMVGLPAPAGGVWLIASKELNEAEVRAEFDRAGPADLLDYGDVIVPPPPRSRYRLTVDMRRWILIEAGDYPAAFAALFAQWSPEPEPAGRAELPPAAPGRVLRPLRPGLPPGPGERGREGHG